MSPRALRAMQERQRRNRRDAIISICWALAALATTTLAVVFSRWVVGL